MPWKMRKRVLESPEKSWIFNYFFLWQPCNLSIVDFKHLFAWLALIFFLGTFDFFSRLIASVK